MFPDMRHSFHRDIPGLLLGCLILGRFTAAYSSASYGNEPFDSASPYGPMPFDGGQYGGGSLSSRANLLSPGSATQAAAGRFLGRHTEPTFDVGHHGGGQRFGSEEVCAAESLPDLNAFLPGIPSSIANQSPMRPKPCAHPTLPARPADPADLARLTSSCAPGMYTPPIHRTPPPPRPRRPHVEPPFVMPKIDCPPETPRHPAHIPRAVAGSSPVNSRCHKHRNAHHHLHAGQGGGPGFGFNPRATPCARHAFLGPHQLPSHPAHPKSACSIDSVRLKDGRQVTLDPRIVDALKDTVSRISNDVAKKIEAAKCGGPLETWSPTPVISRMGCDETGPSEEELERRREDEQRWEKIRQHQEAERILHSRERFDVYSGTPCVEPPHRLPAFAPGPPGLPCSMPFQGQPCQGNHGQQPRLPTPGCGCNGQQNMLAMHAAQEALLGHREAAQQLLMQAQRQMACGSGANTPPMPFNNCPGSPFPPSNPFLPDPHRQTCHPHHRRQPMPQPNAPAPHSSRPWQPGCPQPFIDPTLKKCHDALYPDSSKEPPSIEPPPCYQGPRPLPAKMGAGSHPSEWTDLVRPLSCASAVGHAGPAIKIAWRYRTAAEMTRADGRSIDGRQGYGSGPIELIVNDNVYDSAYLTERQLDVVKNHFADLHYFRLSDHGQHPSMPADSTHLGPGAIGDIGLGFMLTTKRYISLNPPSVVFEGNEREVTIVSGAHRYTWHCGSMEQCYDPILRLPSYNLTISSQAGPVLSVPMPDFRIFKSSPELPLSFMGCPLRDFGDGLGPSNEIQDLVLDKSMNRVTAVYLKDPYASCAFTVSPSARMLLEHFRSLGRLDLQLTGSRGTSAQDWHTLSRGAGGHMFRISWRKRTDQEILERRTTTLDGRLCRSSSGVGEYEVIANDNPVNCSIMTHAQLETLKAIFPVAPYLLCTEQGHAGAIGHVKEGFMITLHHVEQVQPMVIVFGDNQAVLPIHFHGRTYELHYGSNQGYVELFHTKSFKLVFPKFSDPYATAQNTNPYASPSLQSSPYNPDPLTSGFSIHRRFENGPIEFHACLPHHEILDVTLDTNSNVVSGRSRDGQICRVQLSRASVDLIKLLMSKGFFTMNQFTELGMGLFPPVPPATMMQPVPMQMPMPMPMPTAPSFPALPPMPMPMPMGPPPKLSLGGFIKGVAREAVAIGSNEAYNKINNFRF